MRYLPRPIGQRCLSSSMTPMYSSTRPLVLVGVVLTAIALPLNGSTGRLDVGEASNGGEEISESGEGTALALGNVVVHLVLSGDGVSLQGEVVVTNVGAGGLDAAECLVGDALNGGSDGWEHGALGSAVILLVLLGLKDTSLDGGHDGEGHPLLENTKEHLADLVVDLVALVPAHVGTGHLLEHATVLLLAGSNGVGKVGKSGGVGGLLLLNGRGSLGDDGLVEVLGSINEVLLRAPLGGQGVLVEEAQSLGLNHLLDGDHLMGGSDLVLVHELTEDTLGTRGDRHLVVVVLHQVLDSLLGLVGAGSEHSLGHVETDTRAHDGDLGLHTEVDLLHLLHKGDEGGTEDLAGIHDARVGGLAGGLDVLHGLGEVGVPM